MKLRTLGFVVGLVAAVILLSLPTPATFVATAARMTEGLPGGLDAPRLAASMQSVLAVLVLMVCWWLTEAVPLAATALLPAVLFPLLQVTGVQGKALCEFNARVTLQNYANPVIYLFLGGFLLAGAMQKWGLDRRFTLWFLTRGRLASSAGSILFGMMAVTAFVSMWISNTAATAMMLPLGLGVLTVVGARPGASNYGTAMMLGIAWAASIGGVGTLIGTPPNGIAVGILNTAFAHEPWYHRITFLDWMKFGVPSVVLFLPLAWFILMRRHPPEVRALPQGRDVLEQQRSTLGRWSRGERLTIAVFLGAVLLWITNPFWPVLLRESVAGRLAWLDEYLIGLLCGALLFFIPVNLRRGEFLLDWGDTRCVDWGTLLLFGGGIALSDAMFKTGLASWVAGSFVAQFGTPSTGVLVLVVVLLIAMLTEITSNTAVTTMMVPVVVSIAQNSGANPLTVAVATALAASMAFMLPVATPPNALVYGTGYVRARDMLQSGLWLDLTGWLVTVFVVLIVGGTLWGVLSW